MRKNVIKSPLLFSKGLWSQTQHCVVAAAFIFKVVVSILSCNMSFLISHQLRKMKNSDRIGSVRQYNKSELPRLRWTTELHDFFVEAVEHLGGKDSKFLWGVQFWFSQFYLCLQKIMLIHVANKVQKDLSKAF